MKRVYVDITVPFPNLHPGDRIVGVYSTDGIVDRLVVERVA